MHFRLPWLVYGQKLLPTTRRTRHVPVGREFHSAVDLRYASASPPSGPDAVPDSRDDRNNTDSKGTRSPEFISAPEPAAVKEQDTDTEVKRREAKQNGAQVELKNRGWIGYRERRQRLMRTGSAGQKPEIKLPAWFATSNIIPWKNLAEKHQEWQNEAPSDNGQVFRFPEEPGLSGRRLQMSMRDLNLFIYAEIVFGMAGSFFIAANGASPAFPSAKAHMHLHVPGISHWLQHIVESLAVTFKANLVYLDAQDVCELAANILDSSGPFYEALTMLSFETYTETEDHDVANRNLSGQEPKVTHNQPVLDDNVLAIILGKETHQKIGSSEDLNWKDHSGDHTESSREVQRLCGVFDAIVDSAQSRVTDGDVDNHDSNSSSNRTAWEATTTAAIGEKDCTSQSSCTQPDKPASLDQRPASVISLAKELVQGWRQKNAFPKAGKKQRVIVCVRDLNRISMTTTGIRVINALVTVVNRRRQEGEEVVIVGIGDSARGIKKSQHDPDAQLDTSSVQRYFRTILVPKGDVAGVERRSISPLADAMATVLFRHKMETVNWRHVRVTCQRLLPAGTEVNVPCPAIREMPRSWENVRVLDHNEILAISLTAIGRHSRSASSRLNLHAEDCRVGAFIIGAAEEVRSRLRSKRRARPVDNIATSPQSLPKEDPRINEVRRHGNHHEKQLLGGIVTQGSLTTTFDDIRAPKETIEALKTLTSLSLLRPEAFDYGVLKTDRIPGLLLYGPPGTGKTLLAKAVAKQSGASFLSVGGAELNQALVGESEKMVRALFSLASKLSPCVVFIDEADAMLQSRGTGTRLRPSHREMINQFLHEWDGMTDRRCFIMVATNRPFDLDDAALRRLPRRLLVDLPTEADREAILQIHLRGEILAPDVSLAALAARTPFYSGSDLKNVAVAAALACVREEHDEAERAKASGTKYEFPEKRTLHLRQFDKALGEISASVSEDMGSLKQLRKFDEKYGDRRGRRKKNPYGFFEYEVSEADARVRS